MQTLETPEKLDRCTSEKLQSCPFARFHYLFEFPSLQWFTTGSSHGGVWYSIYRRLSSSSSAKALLLLAGEGVAGGRLISRLLAASM